MEKFAKKYAQKYAFIFPGQGSQSAGMGLNLYENFESARNVYDTADSVLGKQVSKMCFEGPDELLKQTINAQSAIVATSIASLEAFRSVLDITPVVSLGHSLGEYCAMYATGVMDLKATMEAIQKRSEYMDLATKKTKGTMTAVIGSTVEIIENAVKEASSLGSVQIANYNDPTQIVITGEIEAVNKASEIIKEHGARKVIPLAVSGGFHSKLMNSATEAFKGFVEGLKLSDAQYPVITNTDARATLKAEDFRAKMPRQINSSVMWHQSILKAIELGVDTFIEFGNGRVLAGLNRKICPELKTYNVSDLESINAIKEELMIGV